MLFIVASNFVLIVRNIYNEKNEEFSPESSFSLVHFTGKPAAHVLENWILPVLLFKLSVCWFSHELTYSFVEKVYEI